MKKRVISTLILAFGSFKTFAQDFDVSTQAENFWDDIADAAPYILATIFIVSALANVGKLSGENRDYMAFFRGLALWAVSMGLIVAVVSFILNLSF